MMKIKKSVFKNLFLLALLLVINACSDTFYSQARHDDYIKDSKTAIALAEIFWLPVYGERIYDSLPFNASLKGNVWIVSGSIAAGHLGGVPYIEVRKYDGKVLKMTHFK